MTSEHNITQKKIAQKKIAQKKKNMRRKRNKKLPICCICYERIYSDEKLPCNHIVHWNCIGESASAMSKPRECPLCRMKLEYILTQDERNCIIQFSKDRYASYEEKSPSRDQMVVFFSDIIYNKIRTYISKHRLYIDDPNPFETAFNVVSKSIKKN